MKTTGRFEIREVLGEGGMGVVYRAYDPVMSREVTLKTIRNPQDKTALELFKREITVLSSLAHPNIVEIHDVGEIDEAGGRRPYFVMPLLRGVTLDELIKSSSLRLTVEGSIQIMGQICRGLQAAHDSGLVHRDLKPSNIFVLEDDSVKVIDFGVAHLIDQRTTTGLKGTLLYMAPEQLLLKPPSPLSDQFSVAVVCYEMLAHRHPFTAPGYRDPTQAILTHTPAPVCNVNQSVSRAISQVVHKGMAKEPFHRFPNVREFADCLQKALRNEPIEIFDPSRIEPRLERVRKAMQAGDLDFAGEILRELESESFLNPEISQLRERISSTKRQQMIQALLETARRRFEEGEYLLALQKVQEILDVEPGNTDARTLQGLIEDKRSSAQIEGSLRLAQQHLENHAYDMARQTIQKILVLRPKDNRAQALLAETDRREQESVRVRQEKEKAYQAAVQSFQQGEVSSALSKLERVLELDRRTTDGTTPEQSSAYQKLYDEVRSKRDQLDQQYAEVKKYSSEGNLNAALTLCDEVLREFPNNVVFHSLKFDIEEAKREEISAYIAKIEREVAAEPDLNRRVSILEEARQKYPQEERFRNSLERVKLRRDQVQGIVARATSLEDSGQFSEALGKWEDLRKTYPQYPGLDVELERLKHRREQQGRLEAKGQWVAQIDQALRIHNYSKAVSLADEALVEFAQDAELAALKKSAQLGLKRAEEAGQKLAEGQDLLNEGKEDEGLKVLREALKLDPQSQAARKVLVDALLRKGRALLDSNWQTADSYVVEAQELDPGNPLAKSLRTLIQDRREGDETTSALSKARELQAQNDLRGAIAELDGALLKYPGRERLEQLRGQLLDSMPQADRDELRLKDLQELQKLNEQAQQSDDPKELESIFAKTRVYSSKYSGDTDFIQTLTTIETRVYKKRGPVPGAPPATGKLSSRPNLKPLKKWLAKVSAVLAKRPTHGSRRLITGSAAVLLIAALVIAFVVRQKQRNTTIPTPSNGTLTRVLLKGQTDRVQILDSTGQNVVAQLSSGLPVGDYTVVDSKAGFAAARVPFTIAPGQGEQEVQVQWKLLPVFLLLPAVSHGTWTLDRRPVTPPAPVELVDGPHELMWASGNLEIKLPLRVVGGKVEVSPWKASYPTAAYGLAVWVGADGVTLQRLRVQAVQYRVGSADPGVINADGPVVLTAKDQPIAFEGAQYKAPLGKTSPLDLNTRAGEVYVFFTPPPQPASGIARKKKEDPNQGGLEPKSDTAIQPPPPPLPEDPEVKKQREREAEKEALRRKFNRDKSLFTPPKESK